MLVGICLSVNVMVGVVEGMLLVGCGVAVSVGVRSPLVSTVLMLPVALCPVEMYIGQYTYILVA